MEVFFLALALAVAEEPEHSVVEEAQQLNVELEELLAHLRSLPDPEPYEVPVSDEANPAPEAQTVIATPTPPVSPQ